MAIQRVVLDARGSNILSLFENNMSELGALNQLAASPQDGGVYRGPDKDVNINYPRDTRGWNKVGRYPGPYESYHVREITLQHGFDEETGARANFNMITKEQNDGTDGAGPIGDGAGHVRATSSDSSFQGKSNTTLLQSYGAYSNESGNADPSKFMELKGRKSLFTLLQETKAAFFDNKDRPVYRNPTGGADKNHSNKYGDNYESYDWQYMDKQGANFVDPPSGFDMIWQALVGFNLGQVSGGNVTIEDRIRTEAQNISRDIFFDMAGSVGAAENEFVGDYFNRLAAILVPVDRISQLYVPGWNRPAENWLTKKPLSENLNQNILLPPKSGEVGGMNPTDVPGNFNDNGAGIPGFGNTEATFQALYTRNRAGKSGGYPHNVDGSNPVFNNGMIAGTPISLLQEPAHVTTSQIKGQEDPPANISVPFTYEEDDARYLTYPKRETGFTSNGPTTTTDPSRMEPAVHDFSAMVGSSDTERENATQTVNMGRETIRYTQGQYFPFAFSTVNKKRHSQTRLQVCYLQAIINSLGESYAPTWSSKHFFGRTEQTHTYTFTDRTIDISFTIFANEMRQLQNVYERVVWLAQQCYPGYGYADSRMQEGPIISMRVGDLFQCKAGIIRSLAYDWMFGTGKWEMTSGMRMPQGVTVTMSYQVMHDRMPSRDTDFYAGPAGGLQSSVQRFRKIANPAGESPFDAFQNTTTTEFGFGEPLIDSGTLLETTHGEVSFLGELIGANAAWHAGAESDIRSGADGDLRVPTAPVVEE